MENQHKLLGIIGDPVSHSLSPAMHMAALNRHQLPYVYVPIPVSPDKLSTLVNSLRLLPFKGINVTIPHKQTIIPYLDQLAPCAKSVAAVNTVVKQPDNQLIGYNTDGDGFMRGLSPYLVVINRALIIGSGGAAAAVIQQLHAHAIKLGIATRNHQKANQIKLNYPTSVLEPWPVTPQTIETYDLIVNTTPIGMTGFPVKTWLPESPEPTGLTPSHICYDTIYTPQVTPFIQAATTVGATVINGTAMLVGQGEKAFFYFTGQYPETDIMSAALAAALG